MIFKRRDPANWYETFRILAWPRRSWMRSSVYITKRILRLTATPHAIAAGVAAGVFASFTPFLGLHFMIAWTLAFIIGGNFIAATSGTFFGNPISFPIIWASTHQLGGYMLERFNVSTTNSMSPYDALTGIGLLDVFDVGIATIRDRVADLWEPIIFPMVIGSLLLGTCAAISAYIIAYYAAVWFRSERLKKLSLAIKHRSKVANSRTVL